MKFTVAAALAALASSVAGAPEVATEKRWFGCLNQWQAETIVNKYISIMEGADYKGQSPNVTADQIIAKDYTEYSDSILSLEKAPIGNTPSATSQQQWLSEVLEHPDANIQTDDILISCNKIAWFWTFPNVSGGPYRVKGSNLLTINFQGQVCEAKIEFNSIAWGADDGQLYAWCSAPSNSSS